MTDLVLELRFVACQAWLFYTSKTPLPPDPIHLYDIREKQAFSLHRSMSAKRNWRCLYFFFFLQNGVESSCLKRWQCSGKRNRQIQSLPVFAARLLLRAWMVQSVCLLCPWDFPSPETTSCWWQRECAADHMDGGCFWFVTGLFFGIRQWHGSW